MADSAVPITAGSGTNVDTFQISGGDHQQVVREARGTAFSRGSWSVNANGWSNLIAADPSRVSVLLVSGATGTLYINFGTWIPTSTAYDWFLDPGDRWELPIWYSTMALSFRGSVTGGTLFYNLITSA